MTTFHDRFHVISNAKLQQSSRALQHNVIPRLDIKRITFATRLMQTALNDLPF